MFFPHWGLFFYRVKSGLFIFPIREIFFSNWASDFARFLNHDAKIRNPDLSVVRYHAIAEHFSPISFLRIHGSWDR